jgi:hypothetical protein
MFRGHFILRFVATLLLVGLLIGAGALLFRAGESQGYALGLAASGKELSAPAPGANPAPGLFPGYPFYGYGFYRPFFMPFFGPLGFFGGGLFLLFFFFVISGILRMLFWGRHGMWRNGPGPYGRWTGGPHPWGEQPSESKASESQSNPGQTGQPKA